MIIACDFDGVLHGGEYPSIGMERRGAIATLCGAKRMGCYIILNTCREGKLLLDAINWCLDHGVPIDRINDNAPKNTALYGGNSRKIFADLYIDDRQAGGLPSWDSISRQIAEMISIEKL